MPSLPFELERQIFELAALQDTNHNNRIQIILVAKRVYEWIRPILYRVVIIGNDLLETSGALTIHNWPNAQVTNSAQYVRHLSLSFPTSHEVLEIVSTFPNIENLASWGSSVCWEFLKKMNELPLRRLSLFFGTTSLHKAIELCPAFKNLTHLQIIPSICRDDSKVLIHLRKLTHLSFAFFYTEDAVVPDLLKHCASLRVLIQLYGSRSSCTKSDDPRYLVLWDQTLLQDVDEWAKSANGLVGYWELAEVIIEARKANFFKDTAPSILSRKTWMEHLNDDGDRWYKEWSR